MNLQEIEKNILEKGISYLQYIKNNTEEITRTDRDTLDKSSAKKLDYKILNLKRSLRISKYYKLNEDLKKIINEIDEPQLWMVITENWCGDSAQNLPYIAAIAEQNPLIQLIVLLRDSNPEIMDQFLTNGTRSIPILVVFNESGEELFRWGPRPKAAIQLIKQWKAEGLGKDEWMEKLHSWYSKNKGAEIEKDLTELIKKEEITH
jgi:hypothetical protein